MAILTSELQHSFGVATALQVAVGLFLIYVLITTAQAIHGAYLGPLSKFPGPKLNALSLLPKIYYQLSGSSHLIAQKLHAQYGSVVRIAPNELSFVGDAQTWNDIYGFKKVDNPKCHKDPKVYRADLNGSHSLISANDQDHARMRKILSHAFSDRALKDQEVILKHWVGKLISVLSAKANTHEPVNMLTSYNCTTFDVMGDLTFSENLHMLDKGELSPWVETIFASIKSATILANIASVHPVLKFVFTEILLKTEYVRKKAWEHWNYTKERLDRRLARESVDRPDFWSKILAKGKDVEGGLSLGESHANASLFMLAGTETTATALTGTTFHLLKNPEYLQKLKDEIRSTFSSFEDVNLNKMAQLKYLQACLTEGLRMYPPVPIVIIRQTPKQGCIINGDFVPGDVAVGVHTTATHRSPVNFHLPNEFHPQRWLRAEGFENDNLDSIEPFSYGPRNCLGKNLAWHEMRLILTSVMLHYDLELEADMKTWDQQKVYSLWEKVPLMCTLSAAKTQ